MVVLVSAIGKRQQMLCAGVKLSISGADGKLYISEKDLLEVINTHTVAGNAIQTETGKFDLRKLEQHLLENPWISRCHLYFDSKQQLHAEVTERSPLARVVEQQGKSYYLDSAGIALPLSIREVAEVPVFTNMPSQRNGNDSLRQVMLQEICQVAKAIIADSFWLAQAAQVWISPTRQFEIYPTVGTQVIKLGAVQDVADKLSRCKRFYTQVLAKGGLNAYQEINVSYARQIVAVRAAGDVKADPARAVDVFNSLVDKNRKAAMAGSQSSPEKQGRIMAAQPVPPLPEKPVAAKSAPATVTPAKAPPKEQGAEPEIQRQPKAVMPKKIENN
ncbi:MAG TPA: cell division protein FtsQ/DivIB [Phnomibacter sp.]|nr:cell division protein FtsQ/DivIB [Phnomibacter sp.]